MVTPNNPMIPVAITVAGDKLALLYTSPLASKTKLFLSTGTNGVDFVVTNEIHVLTTGGKAEPLTHCEDFHITHDGTTHYLSYARAIRNKKERVIASSTDMATFHVISKTTAVPEPLAIVPDHAYKDSFVAYAGDRSIRAAVTKDFNEWHITSPILEPRGDHFDNVSLRVTGATAIERGILVTYDATDYDNDPSHIVLGAALFDYDQPYKIKWRSPVPVWETSLAKDDAPATSLGAVNFGGQIYNYWLTKQQKVISIALPIELFGPQAVEPATALERHPENPIITPNAKNPWECEATFNPAAVCLDNKIHILYRAQGNDGVSRAGYASSEDGLTITERLDEPVYTEKSGLQQPIPSCKIEYGSGGGGNGGCEDPRLVVIKGDKHVYLTYTSFDGWGSIRMALAHISKVDFLSKSWNWSKPVFISKPGEIQKNWVLFPEKISGRYAILHGLSPKVHIEYLDGLEELDGQTYINSLPQAGGRGYKDPTRQSHWDSTVRGTATPPLKTKEGWLVLYHGMDKRDPNRYKLGAMLLDLKDPTIIRYRSDTPILEPSAHYENEGAKRGVIFACGSVIKDNTLFVYYGGSDSVACVATAPLDTFLESIMREPQPQDTELPLRTVTLTQI